MAHLLLGEPSGEGPLGHIFDAAILALPTAVGARVRQRAAVKVAMSDLPKERPANVTVIHPNCGALLAKVVMRLSGRSGVVSVIDSDRETLGVVDLGSAPSPSYFFSHETTRTEKIVIIVSRTLSLTHVTSRRVL